MDPIRLYIREVEKIPLLTPQEEIKVARKVKKGDSRARRKMIQSNLRLVINIAKRYSRLGVPMMDLIEEGNLGLMKAVKKFNPGKGYRFSTYAAWWVRQYITRAIANQGKTIRIPVYMVELLSRYKKSIEHLSHKLKRKPRASEIAKYMKVPLKRVREMSKMVTGTYSLDKPIGEDGTSQFIDILEDESVASPVDEVGDFLRSERIQDLLKELSPRDQKILAMRYGLKDGVSMTLAETARKFHVTRERIRQIEESLLKKLKTLAMKQESKLVGR